MKVKYVIEIRDNYAFYLELLKDRKFIIDKIISISNPSNNAHYLEYKCNAPHIKLPNDIDFIVRVQSKNHKRFEFKLMCKDLYKEPYFRFESHGVTHRNNIESTHLPDQQIVPPHFHFFDEKGYNVAYKTEKLQNETEAKALEDISLCIAHYCMEGNVRIKEDDLPSVTVEQEHSLFAGIITDEDPNLNVNFD